MSRPSSGKRPVSGKLGGGGMQMSGTGEVVSYEDLLVAQYLEELKKSPPYTKPTSVSVHQSPYLQKLAHTHIVPTTNMSRRRPASAIMVSASSKPKVDPKFIADSTLWDPATPREDPCKRRRPISAPVHKRPMSSLSSSYGASRPTSAKSSVHGGKRVRSLYKRQPRVIVVTAFKNGDREVVAKVAAPTIKILLENCTDKLGLSSAARRIFLDDGTEVFTSKEIPRDSEVFISCGESFKDPFKPVIKQDELSKSTTWTRNGVVWNQDCKKRATKPRLSKRFRNLLEQSKRRVLVFKNGHGSQGNEIVADPDRFEDFLVACTAKLDLGIYARALYDWEGNEINNLQDAPVLDQCLQTWSTPVLGPLWVSKGEGFSPKGVCEFLDGLINYTKGKLKEAEHYKRQLQFGQSDETKDKVEIVTILSMSAKEIEESLDIVNKDTEDFGNALNRLKQQKSKIKQNVAEEQGEGFEYTLKHIEKIEADHRMVGTKGIRLRVYENGTDDSEVVIFFNLQQAVRGIGHDKEMLLARLLDQCGSCSLLANPKLNPAIRPIPKKIYDNMGSPITDVFDLEYDQEIWLSFGEPWKNPFTYVVSATFDKIRALDIQGANCVRTGIREQLMVEDVKGKEKSGNWEVIEGIPDGMYVTDVHPQMDPVEREHIQGLLETSEIHPQNTSFLSAKDNVNLLLYAEVVVDTKKKRGNKDLWPADAQSWVISKNGYIYSKAFPQLVLGASEYKVSTSLRHPHLGGSDHHVEGFAINIQRKASSAAQQWDFTPDGFIQNAAHPGLCLTYLGAQFSNEESQVHNEAEGTPSGFKCYLALCDKQEGRALKAQRWALKQERLDNLGQWKHTRADNPEWSKRALSWPVSEDGILNDNYDWPMEGYLLPYAPPIKVKGDQQKSSNSSSIRLMVLKNGERDLNKLVPVVGPDLTNMRKDHEGQKKKSKKDPDAESIDIDISLHCNKDMSILQLELVMFLERCTSMLDLPFAARRLFDQNGKEHFSLRSLERDQVMYVTCGEAWADPSLSKAEQQRRHLLANLNRDLDQIRQFVLLRNPSSLVLEVDGGLSPGSPLIVSSNASGPQEEVSSPKKGKSATFAEVDDDNELFNGKVSAHEIAHQRAEERLNRLKWPWERIEDGGFDNAEDGEEKNFSNKEMYRKFKQKVRRSNVDLRMQAQKFVFEDGYIMCQKDRSLVLTVSEQEGRVAEVTVARLNPDNIFQRWILCDNNNKDVCQRCQSYTCKDSIIQSKNNANMVLTVGMPSSVADHEDPLSYIGCAVTLQQRKTSQFGRANQRWHFDANTGIIEAFHTDTMDKEITAANKANVCTFSVMGATEIDQPGYVVEMQISGKTDHDGSKLTKKILVCSSCARAMRGRHKLERVKTSVDFACSMGIAKQLGIRQIGSFQCLNGKVDLSTFEAEHTLEEWEGQLDKLREELSVRTIAREISAARTPYTVKVMSFRNGEGRLKPGEIIVGSSVAGILEQATARLGLQSAARRLYTHDGTVIMDLDDLVVWVREEYVREARLQMRREAKAKRLARTQQEQGNAPKLMDKVQLDSDVSEDDGEEEEEEEVEERGMEIQEVEEHSMLGYNAENARSVIDPGSWRNVIMLPNPPEAISVDGFITQWQMFAIKEGKVALLTLRPNTEADLNTFELTGKIVCEVPHAGHHSLDLDEDIRIAVRKGDVIGFHFIGDPIIPYEIDKEANQNPFYKKISGEAPSVGDSIKMSMWNQNGMRKYAVCARVTTKTQRKVEARVQRARPKSAKRKSRQGPHIDLPPVDMVLKYPIEAWISCGEAFVKPSNVEKNFERSQEQREERAAVAYELEKEKHVLRQMQGRRLEGQNPGQYRSTRNPQHPVLVHGHWQEAPLGEMVKHDIVHQLETHLHEMKASQKPNGVKPVNAKGISRLYTQPSMKRVLVFPNGENLERAVYVWGESLDQLLDNSTTRLNLRKPAKYVFDLNGSVVKRSRDVSISVHLFLLSQLDDFSDIERDQLLCVGPSRTFLQPRESRQMVEIKANWGRARKQYGPQATDLVVSSQRNSHVDVDPFGPSPLAGGNQGDENFNDTRRNRAKSAKRR
ncbi:hypothetical protein CAPTEDRAFT_220130 [Capitella teleta]|uniref:Doublecortin domain-containing protein n=1 Tax=Capitella teleta TaxID=283909 RepID=R7URV3_CAPTE|nr:hypothetical protein CAPTEDRAFT_220130 [Capitella teleta]|eukprot:ELU06637.1 hypothetical protein CAPTEDRAFT_220130 [Capitella teleta]